jgi:glycosyltransferase involved in cell wall biosynthesis
MEQPLVSILMAAYNQEKFIGEAIESVLASTYKNFELIIVDDCSPDNTYQVAEEYAKKDHRIRLYKNENNLGDYPNRNKVASYAKGKYLKYIDGDDAIYYWGLQVVVEMMERFPEASYGLDSLIQDDYKMFPYVLSPKATYEAVYVRRMGLFSKAPTSAIIKRNIFEAEGGFLPLKYSGDFEMWHRLSVNHSVLVMPDGIVWSRIHEASEVSKLRKNIQAMNYQYLMIQRSFISMIQCPLDTNLKNQLLKKIAISQIKIMIRLLIKTKLKDLVRIRKTDALSIFTLLRMIFANQFIKLMP